MKINIPTLAPPEMPKSVDPNNINMKSTIELFYKQLLRFVRDLERISGPDEAVAYIHGQTGEMVLVDRFGLFGDALVVAGTDRDGNHAYVFAHPYSFQLLLKRVKRREPARERQPIGFVQEYTPAFFDE